MKINLTILNISNIFVFLNKKNYLFNLIFNCFRYILLTPKVILFYFVIINMQLTNILKKTLFLAEETKLNVEFIKFYLITIIIGQSKSVLVCALHSLEYVLGLARFRVFVPNIYIYISFNLRVFIKFQMFL